MNATDMIKYCKKLIAKHGDGVVLEFGRINIYDSDNNLIGWVT